MHLHDKAQAEPSKKKADLSFPVIFLLPTRIGSEELQDLEEQIPTLTYDIHEAEVVLGKVRRRERALFELRKHKLATEEVDAVERDDPASPRRKRARLTTSAAASSHTDSDTPSEGEAQRGLAGPAPVEPTVKVVRLAWFRDSVKAGEVLPLDDYIVYEGRKAPPAPAADSTTPAAGDEKQDVTRRALADAAASPKSPRPRSSQGKKSDTRASSHPVKPPALLKRTTSEHDADGQLPPIPDYLHTTYSCQRPTPANPPNEAFIEELCKIRTARTLTGDKVGIRAYSSAIATIASYPYILQTAQGRCA